MHVSLHLGAARVLLASVAAVWSVAILWPLNVSVVAWIVILCVVMFAEIEID